MIRTYLTHNDLVDLEGSLGDYLRSDQLNFDGLISEAKDILNQDVKNRGYELKKMCTLFTLTTAKSDKDHVERTRFIIEASAVTDEVIFTLQGTNDESDETYTTVKDAMVITDAGDYHWEFEETFDYYKLSVDGTATYNAYLVERTFDLPHLYCALWRVYTQLQALEGDVWQAKAEMYRAMYYEYLDRSLFSYDADEDGSIDADETNILHRTMFIR